MVNLGEFQSETLRPLKREEFDHLVERGVFDNEKVELLYGMLVEMVPQGFEHSGTTARLANLLAQRLAGRAIVQTHSPIAASDDSEPEPDVALVPIESYADDLPKEVWFVAEVTRSSKTKDRRIKSRLYAEANIPEYWIVDVKADEVEVRTMPVAGAYTQSRKVGRDGTIRLQHFPDVEIRVADILPTP